MKNILRYGALIVIFSLPMMASAQSVSDLQAQAQALIQKIQQLQAQLVANGGVSTGTGAVTSVDSSSCPNIGRSLKLGSTGTDVTNLQKFLAQDPTVYPEAMVTGYYGALTEKAVQRWQTKYNIVSSGSPATTGYGVVGPRTAAAIALLCTSRSTTNPSPTPTPAPTVGGYIQVSPVSGQAPLPVNVTANVNTTLSCTGATYLLDFGDGTSVQQIPVAVGNCGQLSQVYQHTYIYGGVYRITLSSGDHQTSATVSVVGPSAPGPTPAPTPAPASTAQPDSLGASVTSGVVPLSITFTGNVSSADATGCTGNCSDTIDFGDGSTGLVPLPTTSNSWQSFSISHTYTAAGSYIVELQSLNGSASTNPSISVTAQSSAQRPPAPPSGTTGSYGIMSQNLAVGGDPLSVSIQIALPSPCPSAPTIDWGDATTPTSTGNTCPATGYSQTHTYAQGGSYTISLIDGNGIVQATAAVAISN